MPGPGRPFVPGQVANPGGRSREQRSAARAQARMIQEMTGNGKLMAEFAVSLLIAGGQPDGDDDETIAAMARRNLRRFGLAAGDVLMRDKQWAAEYLSDRGLGRPVVDIDVTSDGSAVGSVALLPIELPAMTDEQLAAWKAKLQATMEAAPPPDDGDGNGR